MTQPVDTQGDPASPSGSRPSDGAACGGSTPDGASIPIAWTRGPWEVDEDDLSIMSADGAHVAQVTDVGDLPCLDLDEWDEEAVQAECLANARLIAAAPALYEALDELAAAVFGIQAGDEPNVYADHDRLCAMSARVRAALSQARGETP